MSSSAIGYVSVMYGPTGPDGNIGNRGPIGPDGPTSGSQGSRGPLAPYVSGISFYSAGAIVNMSDETEFNVSGLFGGTTLTEYSKVNTVDYLDPLIDSTTYSFISSGEGTSSVVIRGLSGSGSLIVTEDSQAIYVDSIYTPMSGSVDAASLVDNTLIYLTKNNQIASTSIGITTGVFYDGVLNFEINQNTPSFSKLLPKAKIKYIQPRYKTENPNPVILNINDAGIFYIRTPNGISAFGGNFTNNEVVSFTLITETDDIWNFPNNVYFETGENYLTCGKSILNLTSFDQGNSWYAVVAARGIDGSTFDCDIRSLIGSCCYYGITGTTCRDFITKNECDAISGTFNPLESCATACGPTLGVCCSNGKCIENASYQECLSFGGKFLFGINCSSFGASEDVNATNAQRLCYDSCKEPVACCKDGICLGSNFTSIECQNVVGGIPFPGKLCSEVDCCVENVKIGACCSRGQCSQATLVQCKQANGIFLGAGESCDTVNCGCFPNTGGVPLGSCCTCMSINGTPQFKCIVTTEANCTNGTWRQNNLYSVGDSCFPSDVTHCSDIAPQYDCVSNGKCCYCDPLNSNITTCIDATMTECENLNGRFGGQGTSCSTSQCDPCQIPCSDCVIQTPGVRCSCNSGTRICESIDDINNPIYQCNQGTYVCSPASCIDQPCDTLLPNCTTNSCGASTESEQCIGTTNIITGVCDSCFPDGNIPAGSGSLLSSKSTKPTTYGSFVTSGLYDTEVYALSREFTEPRCPTTIAQDTIINGYAAQDYYIPIKQEYICGNDLQFCIDIDLPENILNDGTSSINSLRAYIIRTWYPKYFSTNYAAYSGLTSSDGTLISFINPNNTIDEDSVWGSLGNLNSIPFNNPGTPQEITQEKIYNNLGSFLTEELYDHIETDAVKQINMNTVRMIEELNCPLYGYNPRGRYCNYNTSINIVPDFPSTIRPSAGPNFRNRAGYTYAEGISYNNPFYYQSTNIGGRFGSLQSTLLNDVINFNGINGQTYNLNQSVELVDPGGFISKARQTRPYTAFDTLNSNNTNVSPENLRTFGYTDFGYCLRCKSNYPNIFFKQLSQNDTSNYKSIGYYPLNASVNRFSNIFTNIRLYSLDSAGINSFDSHNIIQYGFSNPGHPLTVDYEGDIVVLSGGGFNPDRNVFRYNVANPYINETSIGVKKAPIYKTKHTSIICDSGVMTNDGMYIPDYNNNSSNGNAIKIFANKRKVYGAINNPWYANPSSTDQVSNAETTISKTENGFRLCIKLKNYKDYILTDDQIPTNFRDTYESLMDSSNPRNKRVLNYKNTLRLIIYTGAYNEYSDSLVFADQSSSDPYQQLRVVSEQYVQSLYTKSTTNTKYTLKYGCTNTPCNCLTPPGSNGICDSCNITAEDKKTNAYGSGDLESVLCEVLSYRVTDNDCVGCIKTFGNSGLGGGLSSIYRCRSGGATPINCGASTVKTTISASLNCRNCAHTTPCSCKTSTASSTTTYPAQTIEVCGANLPECADDHSGGLCSNPTLLCKSGCDLFKLTNSPTQGGAISNGIDLLNRFFDEYGYVLNEDYWIITDLSFVYPLIIWKILPSIDTQYGPPQEKYNFPLLSPSHAYLDSSFSSYYKSIICDPNNAPTILNALSNCGVDAILNNNGSCINFCELNNQSCTSMIERIISGDRSPDVLQFLTNLSIHNLGLPTANILPTIGGSCTNTLSSNIFTSKKIYLDDINFICVNMDCSTVDCSQFEDCLS